MSSADSATSGVSSAPRCTHFARWITVAVVVGLVVRVAYILWLHHIGNFWIGDSLIYHGEGLQLAKGDGWVNPVLVDIYGIRRELAMHPPAYSLWLALWSWLGFTSMFAHQLVTIPIGLATIALVGLIGRQVWSDRVGIAAAAIAAVHPSIWSWEGMVLQEPMAILATCLLLFAMLRLVRRIDRSSVLLAGCAAGFAPLTRAELVSAIAICLITILIVHRSRAALFGTIAVGLLAMLVVMPWSIHNSMRFSRFVPLSNGLGVTLASTNCDALNGQWLGYWSLTCGRDLSNEATAEWAAEHPGAKFIEVYDSDGLPVSPPYYFQYPELDEAEVDARLTQKTIEWIKEHPSFLVRSVPARLGRVLGVFRPVEQMRYDSGIEGRKRAVVLGAWAGYYALLPFAILGGWRLKRRSRSNLVMLLAPVFSALAVIAMTFGNTRYRAIAEPTMAVLGSIGLAVVWGYLRRLWNEHPAEQE